MQISGFFNAEILKLFTTRDSVPNLDSTPIPRMEPDKGNNAPETAGVSLENTGYTLLLPLPEWGPDHRPLR